MPNAHGSGYYRFALTPELQVALSKQFANLDEREQRVYADSTIAAYDAGTLTPTQLIEALPQLAAAKTRQTVAAANGDIDWMAEHLYTHGAPRQGFRERVADIFRPRLEQVGMTFADSDQDETRLLRAGLIRFFANTLQDAAVRKSLADDGRAVLGLDGNGTLEPDAAPRDVRELALEMAVQAGGRQAFDAAERHLRATQDAELRGQLLGALGSARDPGLSARARALVLEPDLLRRNEIRTLLAGQLDDASVRKDLRPWADQHFEKLNRRVAPAGAGLVRFYAGGMCSPAEADDLKARFSRRMQTVEGGPRELAQSVEAIQLCAAALAARQGQAPELSRR